MAIRSISEIKADLFQAMEDFSSGKITIEESNNLSDQAAEELKTYNKRLSEIQKGLKSKKKETIIIDVDIIESLKLSDADIELAKTIKQKLRKTAETIVEIGESIIKATGSKPKGYRDLFYKTIGMSSRSAQRYMQIANHVKIQELKKQEQLEGKTMTDLLSIMQPEKQEGSISVNVSRVANSFYARYKDKPLELEKIMQEVQKLIDDSKQ